MEFIVSSKKHNEIIDISKKVEDTVAKSNVKEGLCTVYTPHATCAIIINENYDPNVCIDIINSLNENIPEGKWLHDRIDNNASAHIKASIIGPSQSIPIKNGKLVLGKWQNVMLCDFDGPRERKVIVNIIKSS